MKIDDLAKSDFATVPSEKQAMYRAHWDAVRKKQAWQPRAIPAPTPAPPPPCHRQGAVVHQEPCHCGSANKVPIHACPLHRKCVANNLQRLKIKDQAVRKILTACDHCPDYERNAPVQSHPIPKGVTRFAVGVTSAPRKNPTLRRCVASILNAGFSPTVFAEPGTNVAGLPCPAEINPARKGCFFNYLHTIERLLALHPDAEAIVVFQDDCTVPVQTREFLEHDLWPSDRCGAVSLYSPRLGMYEGDSQGIGFHRISGSFLVGAVAMVFPRRVAELLSTRHREWRGRAKGVEPDPVKKKAVDTWIGHALKKEGLRVYFPNPSLCQHIATHSSIGHGGNRGKRSSGLCPGPEVSPFKSLHQGIQTLRVRYNGDGTLRLNRPLSVVIPGWNCADLTLKCLQALEAHAGVTPLQLIYVDNGSESDQYQQVVAMIATLKNVTEHEIIRFPENRGFQPAANAGMARARGDILLLNNDCYLTPGCLPAMVRHLLIDSQVASVGPLTDDQGSQSIVRHPHLAKRKGQRKSLTRNMVTGFCQLKRLETVQQIGLLDDNLPHGLGTDDDWCHRARAAGWRIALALDAFAHHDHKSTFRRSGQDRQALQREAVNYLRGKGTWK